MIDWGLGRGSFTWAAKAHVKIMASVGISIPPQEHVTSPVAASKAAFDGDGRRFEAFARLVPLDMYF